MGSGLCGPDGRPLEDDGAFQNLGQMLQAMGNDLMQLGSDMNECMKSLGRHDAAIFIMLEVLKEKGILNEANMTKAGMRYSAAVEKTIEGEANADSKEESSSEEEDSSQEESASKEENPVIGNAWPGKED